MLVDHYARARLIHHLVEVGLLTAWNHGDTSSGTKANYCLAGEAYAVSRHGGSARERANGVPNRSGRSLQDPLVDVVQRRHAAIV
ncbi:hypothetical protein PVAP13_1NG485019 [Panicum virgatum]|uniref:Uncharacterized protein n=1 Tax=Panicum virgatum TaxID=38727 RepID=A0A8T0XAG8_PANVG|nr:hypothetical protein PVAP13_1NG485019 [Panicum virgatum]